MSTRIQELMGEDSPYDAARKFSLRGVSVSPQAIYKWLAGGNIDEERLSMLCEIYGSEPAFIRYGIRTQEALRNGERAAATSPEINTPASAKLAHKTPLRRPLIAHPIQMQME